MRHRELGASLKDFWWIRHVVDHVLERRGEQFYELNNTSLQRSREQEHGYAARGYGLPQFLDEVAAAFRLTPDELRRGLKGVERSWLSKDWLIDALAKSSAPLDEIRTTHSRDLPEQNRPLSSEEGATLDLASEAFDNEEYETAAPLFQRVLQTGERAAIRSFLGVSHLRIALTKAHEAHLTALDQALVETKMAVSLDCEDATHFIHLGNVYFESSLHRKAVDFYDAALELDPESAETFHNLGHCYKAEGNVAKAIECFEAFVARAEEAGYGAAVKAVEAELAPLRRERRTNNR